MLKASTLATILLLTTPALADDELLKRLFNGDDYGVAVFEDDVPDPMPDDDTGTTSSDDDIHRYDNAPDDVATHDNPEYLAWYLDGIQTAYRPDGLTDKEFANWVDDGCPGDDVHVCGSPDPYSDALVFDE